MSSRRPEDLIEPMQKLYALFLEHCKASDLKYILTCTTRSKEEQVELVKKGFSRTMKSKHLTGEAFDIAVLLNGKISWKANDYEPYGKIGKDLGLLWGGDAWLPKFIDAPHFEFKRGT